MITFGTRFHHNVAPYFVVRHAKPMPQPSDTMTFSSSARAKLKELINAKNPETRASAATFVLTHFNDPNEVIDLLSGLARSKDKAVIKGLVQTLLLCKSDDKMARRWANLDIHARNELIQILQGKLPVIVPEMVLSSSRKDRGRVAEVALKVISDPAARAQVLMQVAQYPDEDVRVGLIHAILGGSDNSTWRNPEQSDRNELLKPLQNGIREIILSAMISSNSQQNRQDAAETALKLITDADTRAYVLMKLAQDPDEDVRIGLIHAMFPDVRPQDRTTPKARAAWSAIPFELKKKLVEQFPEYITIPRSSRTGTSWEVILSKGLETWDWERLVETYSEYSVTAPV